VKELRMIQRQVVSMNILFNSVLLTMFCLADDDENGSVGM